MSGNSLHWVYARIFGGPNDQGDDMVLQVVAPLFREIRDGGLAHRCFFLRYGEGGFHVRIRFHTNQPELVKSMILAQADDFFRQRGETLVERPVPEYSAQSEFDATAWGAMREPGTIEFPTYEPEFHKYGGINGIPISENIFEASSRLVTHALEYDHQGLVPRERFAMYIMDELLRIFEVPEEERADWFGSYYAYWRRATGLRPEVAEAEFEVKYSRLRKAVALTLERVPEHEEEWLKGLQHHHLEWKLSMLEDYIQVRHLFETNALEGQHPALMAFNIMHVHNNRFGVSMGHESYLAYMLHRYYAEHVPSRPSVATTHEGYLTYLLRRHFETKSEISEHPDESKVPV